MEPKQSQGIKSPGELDELELLLSMIQKPHCLVSENESLRDQLAERVGNSEPIEIDV